MILVTPRADNNCDEQGHVFISPLAADERNFRDGAHYYRFTADDGHEGGKEKSGAFDSGSVTSCLTLTVGCGGGHGVVTSGLSPPHRSHSLSKTVAME